MVWMGAIVLGTTQLKASEVLCGIDVLKRDGFKPLAGTSIGLITNHTGRDREGNRTIDVLRAASGVKLVKLFSPEHGLHGALDENVGHGIDEKTGLPVYSLYGQTRRPTPEMLRDIDTLVFDIQDIGTRFYTYIATMGHAMEEAAKHNIRMVILDRPNPITGDLVDGPPADEKLLGFTAFAPIPLVHGMTVGELAKYFNDERGIRCSLTIVRLEGWKRAMWWDETGLMWVNPSPNMRNPTQALLYPAVGLLETANLSVGRGTDQPFEVFGAPWIDARRLAAALNHAGLPGLRFVPIEFTPTGSKFKGELCRGVYIAVTDRTAFEPARTGLSIAWCLRSLFGQTFEMDKLMTLLANREVFEAAKKARTLDQAVNGWEKSLEDFQTKRKKYLIYP